MEFQPLNRAVRIWLLVGVVMVFFQVFIGGVTRLTDSGLSITEWSVIQGTLPPLNEAQWDEAFAAYQQAAKKQFESLHADMSMREFKVIFFWEYFHRLWARLMGLVFFIPFLVFWRKGLIPRWLLPRLGIVIALAAAAATFGWIMVDSGLNDDSRTWVSAYKLIIHLSIATLLFGYLFWTWMLASYPKGAYPTSSANRQLAWGIGAVLLLQIALGGLMAGMRAGLVHPYWPVFVEFGRLTDILSQPAGVGDFINYEVSAYVKALVQIAHRATAYLLVALIVFFILRLRGLLQMQTALYLLGGLVLFQFALGVLTVVNSIGRIPITYGVLHQAGALLLLLSLLWILFRTRGEKLSL